MGSIFITSLSLHIRVYRSFGFVLYRLSHNYCPIRWINEVFGQELWDNLYCKAWENVISIYVIALVIIKCNKALPGFLVFCKFSCHLIRVASLWVILSNLLRAYSWRGAKEMHLKGLPPEKWPPTTFYCRLVQNFVISFTIMHVQGLIYLPVLRN